MEGHRIGDEDEMLEELAGDIFVDRVVLGEFESDVEHRETEESHPSSSIGLTHRSSSRETLGPVERTDVVETEETSFENVESVLILAVDPPSEVEEKLLEYSLEELEIFASVHFSFNLENSESSPAKHNSGVSSIRPRGKVVLARRTKREREG